MARRKIVLGKGAPYQYEVERAKRSEPCRDITLSLSDLMHLHVVGKSGYGKSFWLASLFVMLFTQGVSVSLIDPTGDLSLLVLQLLVQLNFFERYPDAFSRLLYLSLPGALQVKRYLPYNVLNSGYTPYETGALALEALRRAGLSMPGGHSVNIDTLIKNSAFVLASHGLPLMPYISYLLTNQRFREKLLAEIDDQEVVNTFAEFGFTRKGGVQESLKPTIRRLAGLSFSPELRYSLGQKANVLDFRQLLSQNRSVILDLSLADPDTMPILGCFYTVYAEMGAKQRGRDRSTTHMLILDEFQNFVSQSGKTLGSIFEQCRKHKLFLTLAHQHWEQVPSTLRGSINQVEISLAFRLEEDDAKESQKLLRFPYKRHLQKELVPSYTDFVRGVPPAPQYYSRFEQEQENIDDIMNLPKQEAYIRRAKQPLHHLRAPRIDTSGVPKRAVKEVEKEYLKLYFTPEADVKADIATTLAAIIPESNDTTSDTIDDNGGGDVRRNQDYDPEDPYTWEEI